MAAPSIATSSRGTSAAITYPAGLSVGDLLTVFVQMSGNWSGASKTYPDVTITDSNGAVYSRLAGNFVNGTSPPSKLSGFFTRKWDGSEGALTATPVNISGTPTYSWSCSRVPNGEVESYTPGIISSPQATGTTFSFESVTTAGPDRLILLAGMAGTPTTAIDTATVSGATNVDGARSGTTIAGRVWSFVQATAGATGTKTSSTVASSGSILDQYTVAIKSVAVSVTVTPTGVAASAAAGTLTARSALTVTPTGASASPAAGALTARGGARSAPTGVAAAPAAGTLTGKGGARAAPAGVAASPAAGTLSVTLRIIVAPTGVAASPAAGTLVARGGARAAPAGVAASPAAGAPVATGGALLTLDGIAASPAAGVLKTFGVFDLTFIRSADHPGQYLIEITALQGSDTSSGGIETIGDGEIASFPIGAEVAGGLADLRYADRDWIGEPNDRFRANVFYDGRAVSPLIMEAMAPLYPEDERRVQRQFGLIDFINSDGEFDQLTKTLSIDGRGVTVRFGPYMGDYADFVVIASMLGTGWQAGEDKTSLAVQDQVYSLDLPIQPTFYGGTGGADGTADFIGKPKPLCYGAVFNISPVFLDPLNLIYQVHDGAMKSIDAVKDRGGMLTLDASVGTGGDVADYAALVAASVGVSKYATCKAQGLLKLGSSPAGVVTVDMRGDNTGGVYVDTIEGIAIRILETRTKIDMTLVDTVSFHEAVGSSSGAGLYISANDVPTTAQVISSLLGSLGGWWGAAIDGKIRAGRIRDPKTIDADKYLDTFDILNIEPEQKPIPRWRQRVSYAPNYTIQRGEDLDVTVTDTMRQTLAEPYSIVTASSSTLQVRHPMAFDPPVLVTQLADKTEAQAVADALQALFGVEREIIRISVKRIGMTINLGDCVNVTYPRFGLSNGKNFIVIGRSLDADRQETELRLWG